MLVFVDYAPPIIESITVNTEQVKIKMNALYYRLDKAMCKFSAQYVAFNKATNRLVKNIKHEKKKTIRS